MKQNIHTFIIVSALSVLVSACGQKGPLILQTPANGTTPATSTEVSDDDPILNRQTKEAAPSY